MMIVGTTSLWFFAVMASLVFGAATYETLVVHPAWSRKPPESLRGFIGPEVSWMHIGAFWKPVAALYALSALIALGLAFAAGNPGTPLIIGAACAVAAVASTLVYFRPVIERFFETKGADRPDERLQSEIRRWVQFNWIRTALVAIAWWGALSTLMIH